MESPIPVHAMAFSTTPVSPLFPIPWNADGEQAPLASPGVSQWELLRHWIAMHAQQMTAGRLLALRDDLARATQLLGIDPQDEIQHMVRDAVQQALAAHVQTLLARAGETMLPLLQQAVAQLPHEATHPGAVALQFIPLLDIARELLQEQGLALNASKDSAAMQRELVQALCSLAVQNAAITYEQLCGLLQALPPQQQVELRQTTQRLLHTAPVLFLQAMQQASLQWLLATQQCLLHASQALHAWPALTGHALAEQVLGFETARHQLHRYFSARSERFDSVLSEIASQAARPPP